MEHSWRIADNGIVLGEVLEISVQRTLPSASPGREPPPSYGRAPLAVDQEVVLAGIGTGEICWIGLQPLRASIQIAVRVRGELPQDLDLVSGGRWTAALVHDPPNYLIVPPARFVSGLGPENRRLWLEVVGLRPGPEAAESWSRSTDTGVRVEVLPASEFTRRTGVPTPPVV